MNILITGANGQLGNEMRRVSANSHDRYIFTDVAELDITNIEAIRNTMAENDINVIVNCAAYTAVDKAEDDEAMAELLNATAVANLATAAKEHNATLIHVSTDYVFDGNGCRPYTEEQPTSPASVYGRTKLHGEEAAVESGCNYLIFRTAWLYSPFGRNFVKTMRTLTAERDSLKVVFDQVGSPTYAGDLAALIFGIIENRELDHKGIYHYSNEGVCSWYDFAREICEMSGNKCNIEPCHSDEFPSKVARPAYSVLDKSKVKATFNVNVPHWKESLAKCIAELD
jgi:dTDP-4-dehydrorhamnose reductase